MRYKYIYIVLFYCLISVKCGSDNKISGISLNGGTQIILVNPKLCVNTDSLGLENELGGLFNLYNEDANAKIVNLLLKKSLYSFAKNYFDYKLKNEAIFQQQRVFDQNTGYDGFTKTNRFFNDTNTYNNSDKNLFTISSSSGITTPISEDIHYLIEGFLAAIAFFAISFSLLVDKKRVNNARSHIQVEGKKGICHDNNNRSVPISHRLKAQIKYNKHLSDPTIKRTRSTKNYHWKLRQMKKTSKL